MYRILVRYQIPCQTLWHGCQPLISLGLRYFGTGAAIGGMILDYGVSVLTYIERVLPTPLRAVFAPPLIFSSGCHWQGCSLTYCINIAVHLRILYRSRDGGGGSTHTGAKNIPKIWSKSKLRKQQRKLLYS
jgi:hypothetical protein